MTLAELRATLTRAAAELPAEELVELIGVLAVADARARVRLVTATQTAPPTSTADQVSAEVVAKVFAVPVSQVYEQARQGRLPHVKIGKYVRFDLDAVREALGRGESSKSAALGTRKKSKHGAGKSGAATALLPPGSTRGAVAVDG